MQFMNSGSVAFSQDASGDNAVGAQSKSDR